MTFIDLVEYGRSLAAATVYLSNLEFYRTTNYFQPVAELRPLLHTWSLAVEEQFYIVAPFALLLLVKFIPKRFHFLLVFFAVSASYIFCIWQTENNPRAAFYLPASRAWEMGLGSLVALSFARIQTMIMNRSLVRHLASVVGLACIVIPMFTISKDVNFPGWVAIFPTAGTAILLASSDAQRPSFVAHALSWRPFVFVGKISYSLYLWHWPVLVAANYGRSRDLTTWEALLLVAVSFVPAWLSYRFVETPVRKGQFLGSTKSLFIGAAAASLFAVAVAAAFVFSRGFPERQPEIRNVYAEANGLETKRSPCTVATVQAINEDKLCVRGAQEVAPDFVFIGDSHGAALAPGIFAAAKAEGRAGWQFTSPGYVPAPGRRRIDGEDAAGLDTALINFLERHPEAKLVIITSFWESRVTGASYRDAPEVYIDEGYDGSSKAYNPTALANGMNRLFERFPDRRFIILDDIPTGNQMDVRAYWRERSGGSPIRGGLSRVEAVRQRALYEPTLRKIAEQAPNADYLPLLQTLCGGDHCEIFTINDEPKYVDGDHLSEAGAVSLTDVLREAFKPLPGSSEIPSAGERR